MFIRSLLVSIAIAACCPGNAYSDSAGGLMGTIGNALMGQRETLVNAGLEAMNLAPETLATVKPMVNTAVDSGVQIMNNYNYDPSDTSSIDADNMTSMKQELNGVTNSLGDQLGGELDADQVSTITQLVASQFP